MLQLTDLAPQPLWAQFAQICAIPHPSRHEAALIRHIRQLAEQQGWGHRLDSAGNLILRKPAYPGHEQAPGVILQSHLDMVPQKAEASTHDFLRDPIRCQIKDGWVTATDTTLGADNGIGVAAILALFADQTLRHGPLEALLTINEEAGMDGAKDLQPDLLRGSLLLNLDSEQEGELFIGCAGGVDVTTTMPLARESTCPQAGLVISLQGLQGGHSGLDIHRQRGNANMLLAELLFPLLQEGSVGLVEFEGGSLRNAIPRRAEATIALDTDTTDSVSERIQQRANALLNDWREQEPSLSVTILPANTDRPALTPSCGNQLLAAVLDCPHGVYGMDDQLPDAVETSNNLARVITAAESAEIQCLARSARQTERDHLCQQIATTMESYGATTSFSGAYPGWTPQPDAPLVNTFSQLYLELFAEPAKISVIHAGLECGLLAAAYPRWQMISFGPTIRSPHSPSERVEIASVERFWHYLKAAVERLGEASED